MDRTLINLVTLLRVVEFGSVTKAATAMNVTTSSVSARIKALEKQAGVKLLLRSPPSVSLTSAGFIVYRHAQLIADQIGQLEIEIGRHREVLSTAPSCI